jgi:DNA-binding LacI/PurR family transcriptional regulator
MTKRVLMVGWHPSVVDYSKYPGFSEEKLEAALRTDEQKLRDEGYDASIGFIFSGETATDQLVEQLKDSTYDVVLIGAGVRKDDDHFLVFEKLVNVVHEHAPHARIAFNTGPTDSDIAVHRWA